MKNYWLNKHLKCDNGGWTIKSNCNPIVLNWDFEIKDVEMPIIRGNYIEFQTNLAIHLNECELKDEEMKWKKLYTSSSMI